MNIKTKYNIGDIVVPISRGGYNKFIPCKTCSGIGIITVKETNKKITCPECYGRKGESKFSHTEYFVRKEYLGQIGNIRTDNYPNDIKIQYMLDSSGIGSGILWNENDLFKTVNEAENECKKRN